MEDIMNYIIDQALILIPVLIIIGQMLKSIPKYPDWAIPWALLVLGTGGALALMGLTVDAAIQGILVTGAAVYGNQLWKQTTANRLTDK
ncbi:phage holin family protein [Eubacteriales bacterium OttesenSCG-928-N13]|nr:phage holin family protein [Eubacteriales bacterium OttesenSCG-928-N13]